MHPDIRKLQDELFVAERKHTSLKAQLDARRLDCRHAWIKPVYDPIVTPAYDIPADTLGTMLAMASMGVSFFPEGDRLLRKEVIKEISKADFLDFNLKLILDRKAI